MVEGAVILVPSKRLVAGAIFGVSATLSIAGVVLALVRGGAVLDLAVFSFSFFAVYAVGALLLMHDSRHRVAIVMSILGLVVALQSFTEGYARTEGTSSEMPWGGVVFTWLLAHSYLFIFVSIALLFYLFPTGKLLSPRWRIGVGFLASGFILSLSLNFKPGRLDDEAPAGPENPINPFGLDVDPGVFDAIGGVAAILLLTGVAFSLVSLIVRFRKSRGTERMQLKWFAAASSCFAVMFAANLIARNFFSLPLLMDLLMSLVFMLIPISIGVAILRYRLYEIDVFINRALVYGTLTIGLLVAYLALVVVLRVPFDPITGESDLAVAASTLAVAALVRPLRARLQHFVDRRFYRRKYDSAKTLASLSVYLRNEVEIEEVRSSVLDAVRATVQPTHATVWLRTQL